MYVYVCMYMYMYRGRAPPHVIPSHTRKPPTKTNRQGAYHGDGSSEEDDLDEEIEDAGEEEAEEARHDEAQ